MPWTATFRRWLARIDRERVAAFARFLLARFIGDKCFQAAGALAYATVFALVPFATVVFLDLDGFKQINDAFGHDAGDALLVEVGARLRRHLRSGDLVARLGGDEFLVVLEDVQDLAPVEAVAKKLLAEIVHPYRLAGREANVTASIGLSVFPDDAADAAALMKHADTAMYAAKQKGKNTYSFYRDATAANDPGARSERREERR